ncbi:SH3 domain-containing protein [Roseovarius phycicola]|uniref:SH3 domain-containing protein n=1 Tax=Roseovarius phycicola TaxID=3080976 RepID=A0ABZ2HHE5_9RHOB
MRVLVSILFALSFASAAWSEALPAYYDVTNVAPDDVLNIREAPGTAASIIGKLGHEDTNIEVVSFDKAGEWGQVNIGEMSGWVSLKFLTRQPGQIDDELPTPLVCTGTEPFWTLEIAGGETAQLSRPGETAVDVKMLEPVTASNRTDRYAIFGQGGDRVYTFIFHRDACSDGMSDRAYGMSVDLFLTEDKGVSYVTGCCNLQ